MSFKEGDRVRFKSDPDKHEYRIYLVNVDDTLDLRDETGGDDLDWIPQRLMERVPEPVYVGDVYRGRTSDALYFVVGRDSSNSFVVVVGGNPRSFLSFTSEELHTMDRVRSGKDLA